MTQSDRRVFSIDLTSTPTGDMIEVVEKIKKMLDQPLPPSKGEPVGADYIQLNFNGIKVNLRYSDQKRIAYFVPGLCEKGLRQQHVVEAGGLIFRDVHITRMEKSNGRV